MSFTKDAQSRKAINHAVWLHTEHEVDLLDARKIAAKRYGYGINQISKQKCLDWMEYLRCKHYTDQGICPGSQCPKTPTELF